LKDIYKLLKAGTGENLAKNKNLKFNHDSDGVPVWYGHDGNIFHRVKRLVLGIGYVLFFPEKRKRKSCQSFITTRLFPKTMK
jgi:hypothetical protein